MSEKYTVDVRVQDIEPFKAVMNVLGEWLEEVADRDRSSLTRVESRLRDRAVELFDA